MSRSLKNSGLLFAIVLVAMTLLFVPGRAADKSGAIGQGAPPSSAGPSFVQSYFYPSSGGYLPFGFYGGYFSPFIDVPTFSTTYPYLPKYWWVERYPSADPRQAGYNPNSGYPKEEVTTLLLATYPLKTRVVLDGIFVGTSDNLGPFQLPMGVHTLRIEAPGYQPSDTVLNVEQPTLEQLDIRLKPVLPAMPAASEPRQ